MPRFSELSLSAQTLYAQAFDAALAADVSRSIANIRGGSIARKTVKGAPYFYFQYRDVSGAVRQIYLGPDSARLRTLIDKADAPSSRVAIAGMARGAVGLGCTPVLRKHFRVIERLSEYGFFRAGGVLIGTHAFLGYGNMLGVRWGDAGRTQDVDLAHAGKNLAIALPADVKVETHGAIESLEMGLIPISGLAGKAGATYLNPADPELRLDFLTTLHRGGDKPIEHAQLGVTLQPLSFLEYSLERVTQLALLSEEGAVVVNVPAPERYALHKLIVYGERGVRYAAKSSKDLAQSAALLEVLKVRRLRETVEAWRDLIGRGPGWTKRAKLGLAALDAYAPELEVGQWLGSARQRPIATREATTPSRSPRRVRTATRSPGTPARWPGKSSDDK
jgi:hypothetical protein